MTHGHNYALDTHDLPNFCNTINTTHVIECSEVVSILIKFRNIIQNRSIFFILLNVY